MAVAVISMKGVPMKYRIEAVRDNSILEEMGVEALTQYELAEKISISRQYISKFEQRDRKSVV